MKSLTLKLVLPLTIFSFALFTKWWYVQVDDWTHVMYGFPLIYSAPSLGSSLTHHYFVIEFLFDFLIYFVFWFAIVYSINRFLFTIKFNKVISIVVLSLTGILICLNLLFISDSGNTFSLKRPYKVETIETGYKFIWEHKDRSYYFFKYHQEEKNQ